MTGVPETRVASPWVAWVGRMIYRALGWRCRGETPTQAKFVILAAPHTSNWDGFFLLLAAAILRLRFSFFGKDTLFRGPLGWFLRRMGGIPLDRSRNQSLVTQAVRWFDTHESFALGVAPEGTRKLTEGWKTGFHHIALQAKVPVLFGYIDYAKKEAGILPEILIPSDDVERDFEILRRCYGPLEGRHPERQSPIVPLRGRSGAAAARVS